MQVAGKAGYVGLGAGTCGGVLLGLHDRQQHQQRLFLAAAGIPCL